MRLSLLALLTLCASCDFTQFGPLADDASGVALTVPDGYPKPRYGLVVAGWSDVEGGVAVSRVAVSAGPDSQTRILRLWNGSGIELHSPSYVGCPTASDCAQGAGASVIGIPRWRGATLCSVMGAPTGSALEIHCESDGPEMVEQVTGPGATQFGTSLAAVPGGFVVGAPAAGGTPPTGALFFVSEAGGTPTALALGAATSGAASIGTLLAAAPLPGGGTLVAATAPALTAASRVVVLVLNGGTADVRACIDDMHTESVGAIALGDLDGDHVPELVVGDGDGASAASRRDSVQVFSGTGLPTSTGCGAWGSAPTVVACPDHLRGITCGGSSFGAALAIGDVDGNGVGDLVVGARRAKVGDTTEAGAVYVLPGGAGGVSVAAADVLTDSSPRASAHLGTSVAVAPSRGTRSEVIAGAPDANEAIVFLCSGLPNDGPAVGPRCIPAT